MAKLAINGGKPVLGKGSGVVWPQFDKTDEAGLLKVFRSGKWWRGGTIEEMAASPTGKFERAFAKFQGAPHALAVGNGTVALDVALRAAGVKAGDEVIVPSLSFVVTASAVLPIGAIPVFIDCDPKTYQIDPDGIEAAITPRTTAICLVHFGGYPADMDRICRIARKHKLALIEDCAHAHGTQWRDKGVGTFGRFGTLSCQQSKGLTSGEGGIITAGSLADWRRIYRYHHLGRLESKGFYEFYEMSSNYRLTDLQGTLLLTQLPKFRKQVSKKMAAAKYLGKLLGQVGGLSPLPDDPRITRRGYYYYLLKYDATAFKGLHREKFLAALRAEGVAIGHAYGTPIHKYPLFQTMAVPGKYRLSQYRKVRLPVVERVMADEICSVHHPWLLADRKTLAGFAEAVAKIKDHVDELLPKRKGRR